MKLVPHLFCSKNRHFCLKHSGPWFYLLLLLPEMIWITIVNLVVVGLEASDPMWYSALTAHLTPEQQNQLREVLVLADQRKAAAESKKIEQSGGEK